MIHPEQQQASVFATEFMNRATLTGKEVPAFNLAMEFIQISALPDPEPEVENTEASDVAEGSVEEDVVADEAPTRPASTSDRPVADTDVVEIDELDEDEAPGKHAAE